MANTQEDEEIMAAMDAMEAQPSGEAEVPWSQEDNRWSSQQSAEDAPAAAPQNPQKLWWHTQQDDPAHVEASLAAITDATGLDFAAVRRGWDKTRRVAEDADVSYDDSVTAFGELALACKECNTSPDTVPANAVVVINSVRRRGNDNGVKRAIEKLIEDESVTSPSPSPLTPAPSPEDAAAAALPTTDEVEPPRPPTPPDDAAALERARGNLARALAEPEPKPSEENESDGDEDPFGAVAPRPPPLTGFAEEPVTENQRARLDDLRARMAAPPPAPQDDAPRAPQITIHPAGSRAADELIERARWRQTSPDMLKRLSRAGRDALGEEPDLAVKLLHGRCAVVEVEDVRGGEALAKHMLDTKATPDEAACRALGFTFLRTTTLVVNRAVPPRQVTVKALFLDRETAAVAAAFDAEGRTAFHRAVTAAKRYVSAARDAVQGAQYCEGIRYDRRHNAHKQDLGRDAYHTFCHRDEKWRRDATYKRDVVELLFKVCELERIFVPRLGRMRALFRDAMGLVPLSRTLEDYISAPMLVMSESFGCEVHVDKSADKFAESIAWVRGTRRHPWHFIVACAGVAFELHEAAPCFLTLQASCTAHATLRTPGHENHPSKGAAAVTKRTLVTDAAREKFRPGEPREE
ncbi:unnamed protein product [Pelagomonas calceolata]|uniref:Uncharacterized protein n=1 Tax=Pelagomonas calceolata TaxID=35677 RepID=A0A8J2S3U2_9STRA|nr:unnamed protein product [Pelagomonas calceolata]